MTIAILGKGFIGGQLLGNLSKVDFSVISCDSSTCNLLDEKNLLKYFEKNQPIDSLIITACLTRLRANSRRSFDSNIAMIENVISGLEQYPVTKVIYMSSIDIYGIVDASKIIDESFPLEPIDYYAMSKGVGEWLLQQAARSFGFKLTILRLSGIYGIGDRGKSTINQLVSSAIYNKELFINGDGKVLRDFVHIDDLCDIVKFTLKSETNGIFNVATGISYSILEIAHMIIDQIPFQVGLKHTDTKREWLSGRSLIFDITKLHSHFPNHKMTDLKEGLERYIKTLLQQSGLEGVYGDKYD